MTTYRAVVKYALDGTPEEKRRALVEGLSEIAMELVGEHNYTPDQVQEALEEAYADAEYEHTLKGERAEDEP